MKQNNKTYLGSATVEMLDNLANDLHASSYNAGWWHDQETGECKLDDIFYQTSKLLLIHSEVSEATEGLRRDISDDKLPQYSMEAVELADVVIRSLEYCAAKQIPIGEIIKEKMKFNHVREDHKVENRVKSGGKKF